MSYNFTGITFAQQKVLPSDDAIIRRAILPDGILYGCKLSYSGSTLTMAAGQLMICGRQIRHPATQNWAITDATSGFARLVLTIDLSRAASKDNFDQVVDSIEYASAEDGFPYLEQNDINISGTRYQVTACVVSLGAGGITGIVSQLEQSRVEGGGGLNFSVVGGKTQPNDPKENTIWVDTDISVTSFSFSVGTPLDPIDGMVWISTGISSSVAFNCLKKGSIMVYPLSVMQYASGAWVAREAYIYQGEWIQFSYLTVYLYNNGETAYAWQGTGTDTGEELIMQVSRGAYSGGYGSYGHKYTAEKVKLPSGLSRLKVKYYCEGTPQDIGAPITAFVLRAAYDDTTCCSDETVVASVPIPYTTEETVVSMVIPESLYGQELYAGAYYHSNANASANFRYHIKEIWLEGGASSGGGGVTTFALNRNTSAPIRAEIDGITYGIDNATLNQGPTESTYDFTVR